MSYVRATALKLVLSVGDSKNCKSQVGFADQTKASAGWCMISVTRQTLAGIAMLITSAVITYLCFFMRVYAISIYQSGSRLLSANKLGDRRLDITDHLSETAEYIAKTKAPMLHSA